MRESQTNPKWFFLVDLLIVAVWAMSRNPETILDSFLDVAHELLTSLGARIQPQKEHGNTKCGKSGNNDVNMEVPL